MDPVFRRLQLFCALSGVPTPHTIGLSSQAAEEQQFALFHRITPLIYGVTPANEQPR
jgi:hypothetical protein